MNEYLTTALGAEHRRDLLAEAHENGLARVAQEGRQAWWQHLAGLLRGSTGSRWPGGRSELSAPAHRLAH